MDRRSVAAALAGGALVFSGAVLAVSPGAAAPGVKQAAAPPVVKLAGDLRQRPSGLPDDVLDARRLQRATVSVEPRDDRARATVVLKSAPTQTSHQATLLVGFGVVDSSGVCQGEVNFSTQTVGNRAAGWAGSGATFVLNSTSKSLYDDYDCAYAATTSPAEDSYDALLGPLAATYAKPKLTVQTAKLLGAKKLKLLRGEWTTVDVTVKNVGQHLASKVVVTGKGKGLKVKKGTYGYSVYPDGTASVSVKVKLTKKRKTKVKFTATAPSAGKAAKKFTVRPAKAPKRIRDGNYRSKDKRVNFRVKKGKITGFRVQAWTSCGGYPDFPTYNWATYSIPAKKVPRSGIVQIKEKGKSPSYTASLHGRATGKKVKATFRYNGPNRCSTTVAFTAKRIG